MRGEGERQQRSFLHHKISTSASLIREMVFGLEDGIVSTTGAIIGIAAGSQDNRIVILSGMVIVVVEALSMAAGSFLSSKSHRQLLERKIEEERQEIEEKPLEEIAELRAMYRDRGFSQDEVELIVRRVIRDKNLWLEEMITKELQIGLGQLEHPRSAALMMWLSYTVGGIIPILPFVFLGVGSASVTAFVIGLVSLFLLGVWKAKITATSRWRSGLEMLVVAGAAGTIGFLVGRLAAAIVGI
ncbi:hypothetical protein AMJ57_02960 [Parcubacteria bacterium SG8_24]|nr:MAG: hypothetical protein AMJ57_02960 [Parcubacteria bacterium SG8_24]